MKVKKILQCGIAVSLLGGGFTVLAVQRQQSVKPAQAVIGAEHYVEVNTTNFWSAQYNVGDQIRGGDVAFMDKYYGTTRPYLDTATINENATGEIRSDDFNQTGEYVSFLIGGNSCGDRNFVNLWSTDKEYNIAAGITNNAYNGDTITQNMIFKYVFVPEQYRGKCLLYIKDAVADEGSLGNYYRGVTVGDLRINQTWDDVVESFSAHIATYKLSCEDDVNGVNSKAYAAVKNFYDTNAYYNDLRTALAAKTSADDGFEKQNGLINWAYDRRFSTNPGGNLVNINYNSIISSVETKVDGYFTVPMPYNKTGNSYIRAEDSGIGEDCKYRLVSSEFTLSGTGIISAKLGGATAVLELLDENYNILKTTAINPSTGTNVLNPGFQNGSQEQTRNIILNDVRLNTMTRTYLDCSEYIGDRVRVALSDDRTGGEWGLAFFDEVVTYYPTLPSFKLDAITQTDNETTYYGVVKDQYIGPTGENRTTLGKAYDFVTSYYDTMRDPSNAVSYCSVLESQDVQDLLDEYDELASGVKAIVDASKDYTYGKNVTSANWYLSPVDATTYSIGASISYINSGVAQPAFQGGINNSKLFGTSSNNASVMIVLISSIIIVGLALTIYMAYNKRRKENK